MNVNGKEALEQLYVYSLYASDELGEDVNTRQYLDIVLKDLNVLEILSKSKEAYKWCLDNNLILLTEKERQMILEWLEQQPLPTYVRIDRIDLHITYLLDTDYGTVFKAAKKYLEEKYKTTMLDCDISVTTTKVIASNIVWEKKK